MKIKVLGPGCNRCDAVERTVREVVSELAIDATVEHVGDVRQMIRYPIKATPGLIIDEKVVCSGRVPSKAEVTTWITTALVNEPEQQKGAA